MRTTIALIALGACGGQHSAYPLPPNTISACDRALSCGAIIDDQHDACVACLEHADQRIIDEMRKYYGDLPPLDELSCDTIISVVNKWTNIKSCVNGRWYGP